MSQDLILFKLCYWKSNNEINYEFIKNSKYKTIKKSYKKEKNMRYLGRYTKKN